MMHPSCNSLARCSLPLASLAVALLASQSAQAATCTELLGREIPAQAIGLPTSGARVTAATPVGAGGSAPQTFGAYCDVSAEIRPVDPAAPAIRMRLVLPEQWNRKAMMFGGGGYNGTVPNVAGNVPAGPLDQPTPLGRGYAVFGSDSGHVADPLSPGSFAWNDEALANYAHDALKKTRDAAVYLIEQRYGATPERSYFAGGSTGGREALAVVQQWPTDFNGAIVLYPAYNALALDLQFGRITRALAQPGAFPSLEKRAALLEAAMQACDKLDGVRDGVISHQAACNAQFDPARAKLNGKPLRCPGGADTSERCLSDAQIQALRVFNSPIRFNFPLAGGETHYPGFNTWGTDLGRPGEGVQLVVNRLGLNTLQPSYPMPVHGTGFAEGAPYHSGFWDEWVRFFVTRNPTFNSLTLDPQNPGPWQARISELSLRQDVNRTDLSAFARNGGKILMAHGTSDQLVSTRATAEYYERVRRDMGPGKTQRFLRYYEIPGYGHAASTVFNAAWDSLSALEDWVEQGRAPRRQVVADSVGVPGRTRPLCEYPGWPKYVGKGDVNAATSFVCVQSRKGTR
ncbi:tannase/feruloyl esterase family alpha/beta hydrolase [Stutzerimonas stutzeri]|uniref:tannase/feruloyl esterase family alpha/beta hydrolase n=1 Tax=Stutzerimonas stutzeri TaxID=316 RepID=UPI000F7975A5|nr:tannase/feruloyl esterase family alpha/beta hydrolase [Stutzerimonas stutzeri]RRW13469.1 tannase/feruloyl esterase family alpha/beta hydrolase [Stutzerimonas stutzeri]RRW22959.1 tannase/feruloyl esterase family alpha/beta hydrolase [Stutzerimonas stutzeri]